MLLIDDGAGHVIGVRVRLWNRVLARVLAARCDRQLAAGIGPDTGVLLSLRARALTSRRTRESIAEALARMRDRERYTAITGVPLNRDGIRLAGPGIEDLRQRLLADGPVDVRGVALVQVMLTSGAGPLYARGRAEAVAAAVRSAAEALQLA